MVMTEGSIPREPGKCSHREKGNKMFQQAHTRTVDHDRVLPSTRLEFGQVHSAVGLLLTSRAPLLRLKLRVDTSMVGKGEGMRLRVARRHVVEPIGFGNGGWFPGAI